MPVRVETRSSRWAPNGGLRTDRTPHQVDPGADIEAARDELIAGEELPAGFVGISLMSGEWTVLLQTTGESVDDAHDNVRAIVGELPGVDAHVDGVRERRPDEAAPPRG